MGNTASNQVENVSNSKNKNENEEDQMIGKVLDVSKELLSKYNQEFLREDFCFDMGMVLQESLDKLSIPVLQDLGNRVVGEGESTPQLKMIMQYTPKGDDKFFIEGFEKQLEDYFWNQSIQMDTKILEKEGLDVSNLKLFEESNKVGAPKYRYIDVNKINELLRDAQYKNRREVNEEREENVEVAKTGGANLQNFRRELNMAIKNSKNSNVSKMQKKKVNIVENREKGGEEINIQLLRNSLKETRGMNKNSNQNKNKNVKVEEVLNRLEEEIQKKNKENEKVISENKKNISREEIQNTVNEMITKTNHNKNKNTKKNEMPEVKNTLTQYRIRKDYQKPEQICLQGVEKCTMTKKELCKVIADNLMIRSNIVAAILTVLPNRKGKNGYFGGYLYGKFVNLGKCQVCVPYNYKDLMDKDPVELIKQVVQYADFLDYKSCKENGGYYMKLSKDEMEALYANVPEDGKVTIGKQMNYNAFYVECAKKLKECYFGNLKVLLEILEQLRSQPIINNVTLNELGKKTREIIDSMYHLCQYYYVYAIVSILHANLSVAKSSDLVLQKTLAKSLKKNSNSNSES